MKSCQNFVVKISIKMAMQLNVNAQTYKIAGSYPLTVLKFHFSNPESHPL